MWHAAIRSAGFPQLTTSPLANIQKKQERKLTALMVDHKARAERRSQYYKSKLSDPSQLLRITGTACKVYPDAQQFYYHENQDNLLKWQGDGETRIDRFDGRVFLDAVSEVDPSAPAPKTEEDQIAQELRFESFRDLVNHQRLERSEEDVLSQIDEDWNELLRTDQQDTSKPPPPPATKNAIPYVYPEGRVIPADAPPVPPSSADPAPPVYPHLHVEDLFSEIDAFSDKEVEILNSMGQQYGVGNFHSMVRVAKKEMEDRRAEEEAGAK
ncbi:alternative splicing regulator-domain-containing protein, partial [Blyttiomyces helicus]